MRKRMEIKQLLVVLLVTFLLLSEASAEKKRRHRRRTTTTEATFEDDIINMLGKDEAANEATSSAESNSAERVIPLMQDGPCIHKHCGAGRVCQVNGNEEAECVCIEKCDEEIDPRRRVCTNYNKTFGSDCEVYQARCFCDTKDPRCKDPEYQHVHIVYYGECKQMPKKKDKE